MPSFLEITRYYSEEEDICPECYFISDFVSDSSWPTWSVSKELFSHKKRRNWPKKTLVKTREQEKLHASFMFRVKIEVEIEIECILDV